MRQAEGAVSGWYCEIVYGAVQPAYKSSFSACLLSRNIIFLLKKSAGTVFHLVFSAKRTVAYVWSGAVEVVME
jgi:hypothetical protein